MQDTQLSATPSNVQLHASAAFTNASCAFISLWEQPHAPSNSPAIGLAAVSLLTLADYVNLTDRVSSSTSYQLVQASITSCAGGSCNAAEGRWLRALDLDPGERYIAVQAVGQGLASGPATGKRHLFTLVQALTEGNEDAYIKFDCIIVC